MKENLDYQYRDWQEKINSRSVSSWDSEECVSIKGRFDDNIEFHRDRLEVAVLDSTVLEEDKRNLKLLIEELQQFQVELTEKFENFKEYLDRNHDEVLTILYVLNNEEQQGLTAQRIQQFEKFQADESFLDDQCAICMGDFEVGRNMMRLNCDGQHTFCQVCIEEWFATKKTCPICRHMFQ